MTLNGADLIALLHLLVISGASIIVMITTAIRRNHRLAVVLTLAGLALAFVSVWQGLPLAPRQVGPLLIIDGYALFYIGLITAAAFSVVVLSYGYFERQTEHREEVYILLLVAVLGSVVLVARSEEHTSEIQSHSFISYAV